MTATVRLDEKLESKLNNLANTLHKKRVILLEKQLNNM